VSAELPVGCLIALAVALAVIVVVSATTGMRAQEAREQPAQVSVRVSDSGAPGGPKVLSPQVVPLP
jgi:hypothetical protein